MQEQPLKNQFTAVSVLIVSKTILRWKRFLNSSFFRDIFQGKRPFGMWHVVFCKSQLAAAGFESNLIDAPEKAGETKEFYEKYFSNIPKTMQASRQLKIR